MADPILPTGQDPYVVEQGEFFYLIQSDVHDTVITIRKFSEWKDLIYTESKIIWQSTGDHSQQIWAPEMHTFPQFSDKWYIYYAACDGENRHHRMYVLESEANDPMGPYHEMGKIYDKENDYWAIDLTVLEHHHQLYAVWSGWEDEHGDFPQNLYIAPMSNPYTISGTRVCISHPTYPWEQTVAAINEGPQILRRDHRLFIIYSADASWKAAYKLGMMMLQGEDILSPASWIKDPDPVFQQGKTNVIGPGHASFIFNPKDNLHWIVYHSKKFMTDGWEREIRAKKFDWDESGEPIFGDPE